MTIRIHVHDDPLHSAPIRSDPLRSTPLRSSPIHVRLALRSDPGVDVSVILTMLQILSYLMMPFILKNYLQLSNRARIQKDTQVQFLTLILSHIHIN